MIINIELELAVCFAEVEVLFKLVRVLVVEDICFFYHVVDVVLDVSDEGDLMYV